MQPTRAHIVPSGPHSMSTTRAVVAAAASYAASPAVPAPTMATSTERRGVIDPCSGLDRRGVGLLLMVRRSVARDAEHDGGDGTRENRCATHELSCDIRRGSGPIYVLRRPMKKRTTSTNKINPAGDHPANP